MVSQYFLIIESHFNNNNLLIKFLLDCPISTKKIICKQVFGYYYIKNFLKKSLDVVQLSIDCLTIWVESKNSTKSYITCFLSHASIFLMSFNPIPHFRLKICYTFQWLKRQSKGYDYDPINLISTLCGDYYYTNESRKGTTYLFYLHVFHLSRQASMALKSLSSVGLPSIKLV